MMPLQHTARSAASAAALRLPSTTVSMAAAAKKPALLALSRPFSSSAVSNLQATNAAQFHSSTPKEFQASAPKPFQSSAIKMGGGHESHYDPPSGWLFNVPPGEKYKKEGWENIWFYGFFGSFVVTGVVWAWRPDTSIQTWALEEARRRLEAEGILEDVSEKRDS